MSTLSPAACSLQPPSSPVPPRSALHTQIFHGDVLRCILCYVGSITELAARLNSTSRSIRHESARQHLWPLHFYAIQPRTPYSFRHLARTPTIASRVHTLDLTRLVSFRTALSVCDLALFTSLTSLSLSLQYNTLEGKVTQRQEFKSTLITFLGAHGSTISHLRVIAYEQGHFQVSALTMLLPSLRSLDLVLKSDPGYCALPSLTPITCPHVRVIRVTLEAHEFGVCQLDFPLYNSIYDQYRNLVAAFTDAAQSPDIIIRARAKELEWRLALEQIEAAMIWRCVHLTELTIDLSGTNLPSEEEVSRYISAFDQVCEYQQDDPPRLHIKLKNIISSFRRAVEEAIHESGSSSIISDITHLTGITKSSSCVVSASARSSLSFTGLPASIDSTSELSPCYLHWFALPSSTGSFLRPLLSRCSSLCVFVSDSSLVGTSDLVSPTSLLSVMMSTDDSSSPYHFDLIIDLSSSLLSKFDVQRRLIYEDAKRRFMRSLMRQLNDSRVA